MTKRFDSLFKRVLTENTPAELLDTVGGATDKIYNKIEDLEGKSQHWGPLQKLSGDARKAIITSIIKKVFADNEDNTYSTTIDDDRKLKETIKSAIKETSEKNPEFKATGKWAIQFLADRLSNKELLGNVKYTTLDGDKIVHDKDITQKDVTLSLNKAIIKADADLVDAGLVDSDTDSDEIESVSDVKQPVQATYNPSTEYYLKTYEEIPSGTLDEHDLAAQYKRLSSFYGETHTGQDFVDAFSRYGFSQRDVELFIRRGLLEPQSEDTINTGDNEGLGKSEKDFVDDYVAGSMRDWRDSDGSHRSND